MKSALFRHAAVGRLLFCGRPSTVLWAVITVVVDPIKRAALWARPHIMKKRRELVPAIANTYATATVAAIVRRALIKAAFTHRAPALIFGCLAVVACVTVLGNDVPVQAAASARVATNETIGVDEAFGAAIAAAAPDHVARRTTFVSWSKDDQAAEALACSVLDSHATATGGYATSKQMVRTDYLGLSAVACARPHDLPVLPHARRSNSNQATRPVAGEVRGR